MLLVVLATQTSVSVAWRCVFQKRDDFMRSTFCFSLSISMKWVISFRIAMRPRSDVDEQIGGSNAGRRLRQCLKTGMDSTHHWSPLRQSTRQQRTASKEPRLTAAAERVTDSIRRCVLSSMIKMQKLGFFCGIECLPDNLLKSWYCGKSVMKRCRRALSDALAAV